MRQKRPVRILCVAGLDPSGRAGLLADVATVRALGGDSMALATALTAQGKKFVSVSTPSAVLTAQVEALRGREFHAVKFGMIPGPGAQDALLRALRPFRHLPWVVDPVMFSSRAQQLSKLRPKDFFLFGQKNVVLTPNVIEAAQLTEELPAKQVEEAAAQGERLLEKGFGTVVVKGGHLPGRPVDAICDASGVTLVDKRRLPRKKEARGTGCRFGSALAFFLAQGVDVVTAATSAKDFVESYLRKLKAG